MTFTPVEYVDDRTGEAYVAYTKGEEVQFVWAGYRRIGTAPPTSPTTSIHTHISDQITDFTEAVQDAVGAMLVSGANVTLSYDDTLGKLTVTGAAGGDAELMRDTIGAALVGINGVGVAVDDTGDTITLSISSVTQAQVTGLTTALAGKVATSRVLTAGAGLTGGGDLSADRSFAVSFGTSAGTVAQGNDSRIVGAAQKGSNLSDLTDIAAALTNLGLTAPTQAEAEAGTATTVRGWTAQRVKQAARVTGGHAAVVWTAGAWSSARPSGATVVTWFSTTDASATMPTDWVDGDIWERHPDAAPL